MGRIVLTLPVALVALVLIAIAWAQEEPRATLFATVDNPFTITFADDTGAPVRRLDPGTYRIVVSDRSSEHNFRFRGPGVNQLTDVDAVETVTWTVTLTDGIYTYNCDPHSDLMNGSVTVGNPPAAPPPPATPVARRLSGNVGPGLVISMKTASGAKARTVPAGRTRVTVRDRSRTQNFHLVGPALNRKTGIAFTGTATWTVTLRAGALYRYFSDSRPSALRGSFRAK